MDDKMEGKVYMDLIESVLIQISVYVKANPRIQLEALLVNSYKYELKY